MSKAIYDEVISKILVEINKEQYNYQKTHVYIYGEPDKKAENTFKLLKGICIRIRDEIRFIEKGNL
ncbi:MAG: hypothetical protein ACXACY_29345 [Candidatus Hodarchaeales archaeon]|jgi:hypothetical protein